MYITVAFVISLIVALFAWSKKFVVTLKTSCGMTFNSVPLTENVVEAVRFCERYDFDYELYASVKKDTRLLMSKGSVSGDLWQIRSRSGQFVGMPDEQTAYAEAQKRSTKTAVWSVYRNFERVASFVGKKQMTEWIPITIDNNSNYEWWYIDIADDKVRLKWTLKMTYETKGKKLQNRLTSNSVTFHRNGDVYVNYSGKIRLYKPCLNEEPRWPMPYKVGEQLINALVNLRPEITQDLYSNGKLLLTCINDICMVFSYPSYCYRFDTYKHTHERVMSIDKTTGFYTHDVVDYADVVKLNAAKMKVPSTKTFMKMYSKDLANIWFAAQIKKLGITNLDHARRLLTFIANNDMASTWFFIAFTTKRIMDFMKKVVIIKGQAAFVSIVEVDHIRCIEDIHRMYITFFVEEDIMNEIIRDCPNLTSIHDTLVRYTASVKNTLINKVIPYSNEEYRLEQQYDDVTFALAADTKDLALLGKKMGICVGGYANVALSKQCTIVKMLDNGKPVGCIELSDNIVCQMKAKFNNPIELKYKDSIDRWIQENDLEINTTDYSRIGVAWNSTVNYAWVNPDLIEDEHHEDNRLVIVRSAPKAWKPIEPDDDDFIF